MLSFKTLGSVWLLAAAGSAALAQAPAGTLPTVTTPIVNFVLPSGASTSIDLSTIFGLPSVVGPVVQFDTVLGNLDVELYPQYAPLNCANFLNYVNGGAYTDTVIYRSVPGFVEQGGGYTLGPSNQPVTIPTNPPVVAEYHVSNTRGTIAMAQAGGDPNSATDVWFFNVVDNDGSGANNLNTEDGGFTVFGRVIGTGMSVIDAVAALPYYNLSQAGGSYDGNFTQTPLVNITGNTFNFSNWVLITSIAPIPVYPTAAASGVLTFAVTSSNSAATASITGSSLLVTAGSPGTASITVTATDTNGNQASTAFNATSTMASAPVFTTLPQSQSASIGQNVTFTAAASGAPAYQWQFNSAPIAGATGSTLTLSNVTAASAGTYSVVATNSAGSANASATLAVSPAAAPVFTLQPSSQTVASVPGGTTVVLTAAASGTPTPTYQWRLAGVTVPSATSARLVIPGATAANVGVYTCVATNPAGSAVSSPATLSVTSTTNVGRLINLSVNTTAGKSQVLTVGFVTGGAGTGGSQTLLIRAAGPALAALGVPGTLVDPTLTVLSGSTVVTSNDNWGATPGNQAAVTAADNATGAFALTNLASLDAALVTPLAAGGYTVQVSGNTAASGTALAEIYDDTQANSYTLATPRLINISSNNRIAANGSMTAGFVIGGTTAKTVLIRATGPALAVLGVQGTMPDPQLALHATVNGQDSVLAANAGWGGDPQIAAADTAVGAFSLTSTTSKDSALLVMLAPGAYTAVASSVTGTAGIALIEVYEVP